MDFLRAVQSFVCVVKGGSFAAAAEQLNLSPAIVTRDVKQLEQRLRARLLHRTTRRLGLTESGQEYFRFCQKMLADIKVEEAVIARLQSEPTGELKVLAPKSFGSLHVMSAVLDFAQRYPDVRITLLLDDISLRSVELIEQGLDLMIRLHDQKDSSLISRRIGTVRWATCASPSYLDTHGYPKHPRDLANHNCLSHAAAIYNPWRFSSGKKEHAIEVRGNIACNSVIALREAALSGAGIATLPIYCIGQDLSKGELVPVLPQYRRPSDPINILFPERGLMPSKVRLFMEYLAKRFARVS